jgi:iron complex outermembrane receptor protein
MFKKILKSLPLGVLALSAASGAASAQEGQGGIGDIVVTAQKREQKLQDVPVAVTALNSATLETNRIVDARDLDAMVPNLAVRTIVGASRLPSFSMRGINVIGSSPGADRGVAVYVDGVYIGSATGNNFGLADIAQIEVLRGPQGTLFGRNSTGGAINWITKDPSGEFHVQQDLTFGNYDQFTSKTRVETPQWGPFSASLTYGHTERRGDTKNLGAGTKWDFTAAGGGVLTSPDYLGDDETDQWAAAIKFEPTDNLKFLYKYDTSESDFTGEAVGLAYADVGVRAFQARVAPGLATPISKTRPDAVNNWNTVPSHQKVSGHTLTSTWNVTDNITVKNISALRKAEVEPWFTNIDGNGGILANPGEGLLLGTGAAFACPTTATRACAYITQATATQTDEEQKSSEIQVVFDYDAFTLTAGAMWFDIDVKRGKGGNAVGLGMINSGSARVYTPTTFANGYNLPSVNPAGGGGQFTEININSRAVYAQAEFHLTPELDLIMGGRYTIDHKEGTDRILVSNGAAFGPSAQTVIPVRYQLSRPTYNLGLNYKFTPSVMGYGSFSTGFISGGVVSGESFRPEMAESFEVGLKADWFDRRLRTNLALFDAKYTDTQLASSGRNISPIGTRCGTFDPPGTPASSSFCRNISQLIINSGDARAKGFEAEVTWLPIDTLTLTANVGYTDFKFTRVETPAGAPAGVTVFGDVDVVPVQRPDWTAGVSANYESRPLFNDVTFSARLDANFRSEIYMSSLTRARPGVTGYLSSDAERANYEDANQVDGYWLLNGRLALNNFSLAGGDVTVALWGRNLTDADQVSYAPGFGTALPAIYEDARTYGIDLTFKY